MTRSIGASFFVLPSPRLSVAVIPRSAGGSGLPIEARICVGRASAQGAPGEVRVRKGSRPAAVGHALTASTRRWAGEVLGSPRKSLPALSGFCEALPGCSETTKARDLSEASLQVLRAMLRPNGRILPNKLLDCKRKSYSPESDTKAARQNSGASSIGHTAILAASFGSTTVGQTSTLTLKNTLVTSSSSGHPAKTLRNAFFRNNFESLTYVK